VRRRGRVDGSTFVRAHVTTRGSVAVAIIRPRLRPLIGFENDAVAVAASGGIASVNRHAARVELVCVGVAAVVAQCREIGAAGCEVVAAARNGASTWKIAIVRGVDRAVAIAIVVGDDAVLDRRRATNVDAAACSRCGGVGGYRGTVDLKRRRGNALDAAAAGAG